MWVILIFFIAHWYLSLFTQSFFLHRYSAHGMFTMSKGWEKFFFLLSGIFQGSSYLSPKAYGIMHRMHHAFADTENDPHSPMYSKSLFDMMWKTKIVYADILYDRANIEPKFTKNIPEWNSVDQFFDKWGVRIAWGVFYTLLYIAFAPSLWWFLLLPIQYLMGPVHGVVINWFAHKYGYTNFKLKDTAKNLLPFDFLMWGESYHNNHHQYGGRANFGGQRWHEVDPMYPIILLFNKINIIHLKRNNDLNYM